MDISTSNIPLFCGYGDSPVTVKCKKELIDEFVMMCYLFRFPTARHTQAQVVGILFI
jgi:hypothetical protein